MVGWLVGWLVGCQDIFWNGLGNALGWIWEQFASFWRYAVGKLLDRKSQSSGPAECAERLNKTKIDEKNIENRRKNDQKFRKISPGGQKVPTNVQDASWDRLRCDFGIKELLMGSRSERQNGTKIDLGATFGRLGRTFLGYLVANRFCIDFSTILGRFWDGFGMVLASKTEPRGDPRARRRICKNIGFS